MLMIINIYQFVNSAYEGLKRVNKIIVDEEREGQLWQD